MIELELLGANGDVIVMASANGERYTLLIDDALRAAVRRDRPVVEAATPSEGQDLRPREIQALIRAGWTAHDIASTHHIPVEHVSRFEGPVIAERNWAVSQAQACRIGWEPDSPILGDLVIDRLATRGVTPALIEWDATRQGRNPWEISVTFVQDAEEKQARWVLDLSARAVSALNDEARWLTETTSPGIKPQVFDQDSRASRASAAAPRNHRSTAQLASQDASLAQGRLHDEPSQRGAAASNAEAYEPVDETSALLTDLASSRGIRQEVDLSSFDDDGVDSPLDDEVSATTGQQAQVLSLASRRTRSSQDPTHGGAAKDAPPDSPTTDSVPPQPIDGDKTAAHGSRSVTRDPDSAAAQQLPDKSRREPRPRRRSRRSVPSWDEIVFGAKPE